MNLNLLTVMYSFIASARIVAPLVLSVMFGFTARASALEHYPEGIFAHEVKSKLPVPVLPEYTNTSEGDPTEVRTFGTEAFTSVEINGGGITVEITCGAEHGIQILGDPDAIKAVETDIDDGQLEITGSSWKLGKKGVTVKVSLQTLEELEISGANIVRVTRLASSYLNVEMSGACSLDISGKAKKFTVEASGACIVNAKDLIAEKIIVEADGASKIIVNAEKQLCASVSGVSKIVYYGDPKTINKDVCGMGRIVQQTGK